MSLFDLQPYVPETASFSKENLCRNHRKATQRYHKLKKCVDIVYKTLYDPAGIVSKVNPRTLLDHGNGFETVVFEGVAIPEHVARKPLSPIAYLDEGSDVQETYWTSESDFELTEAETPDRRVDDFIPSTASDHESWALELLPMRGEKIPFSNNEITELVPALKLNTYGLCSIKWFTPLRVCISNLPNSRNVFAIFFELRSDSQILRIRINTNTQYPPYAGRNSLVQMLKKMRDFDTLFDSLMDFIWRTWKWKTNDGNSIVENLENFLPAVNSSLVAVVVSINVYSPFTHIV
ncbi:unnamed protein product [Cylicostephanus goldi]|uniref:Uncharacterized protein n=1 Tax=Cylicostephanus goldi TaxID=71465 RepID=A0A3P6QMQ0_CYLGO|nr:unnamed protein product [Cylicostephanus goldi]